MDERARRVGAPTRSHLVHELVDAERADGESPPGERWEDSYAARITARFG
jgi:hypothetical protein